MDNFYTYTPSSSELNTGIFEFDSVYSGNTTDVTQISSGSGVHNYRDLTLNLRIQDRDGQEVTDARDFLKSAFLTEANISILEPDGTVAYANYQSGYKQSSFTFTEQNNIDIFGFYAPHFGIKTEVKDRDDNATTSEFYFYGNRPKVSSVTVTDTATGHKFTSSNGSASAQVLSGTSGQLKIDFDFLNSPEYTNFDHVDIYWASGSTYFNSNPLSADHLAATKTLFQNKNQSVFLYEENIPQFTGSDLYLTIKPYSTIGLGDQWTVGPFKFEYAEKPNTNYLTEISSGDVTGALGFTPLSSSEAGSSENFYLDGASFDTGNGVLTLNVDGATDQTADLDGRYGYQTDLTNLTNSVSGLNSSVINNFNYITGVSGDLYTLDLQSVCDNGSTTSTSMEVSAEFSVGDTFSVVGKSTLNDLDVGANKKITLLDSSSSSDPVEIFTDQTTRHLNFNAPAVEFSPASYAAYKNSANSFASAAFMGTKNVVSGDYDAIVVGTENSISGGDFNFIGGGSGVDIQYSNYSSSIGGENNDITGSDHSIIGGGKNNLISGGSENFIGGGDGNTLSGTQSFIGAGNGNIISSQYSFIGGGEQNRISGDFGAVLAGEDNTAAGTHSVVAGGDGNFASGAYSFIGGGQQNEASGLYSYAFGRRSKVGIYDTGAAVFSDGQSRDHISRGAHTASLDFSGGVYIPTGDLIVSEDITMAGNVVLTGITSAEIVNALGYTPLSTETDDQTLNEVLSQGNTSASGITVGASTISGSLEVSNNNTSISDVFHVDGLNGRLFGVTDEVTGTVFSVNDAAGLPIVEVESTSTYDKITMGEYGSDALVISGANSALFNVDVEMTGTLGVTGDITMGGNTVLTGITSAEITSALGYTPLSTETDDQTLDEVLTRGNTSLSGIDVGAITGSALTIDTDTLFVDSTNDRVGIGTDSPSSKFQIDEYTVGSNGNQSVFGTASIFTNSGSDGLYLGVKNASYPNRGYSFKVTESGVNSDFSIKEHGSSGDRLTIKSGGNVGVGTTDPSARLHIHNSTGNSATIRLSDPDSTSTANATGYIEVYHGEATARAGYFGLITNSEMAFATTTSAGKIRFYTANNTTALTIDSSQNATFAGDVTVNGSFKWATTGNSFTYSNDDSNGFYMERVGTTDVLSDMRFQARASGAGNYSWIKIKPSNQSISLGTNGADRLTINSSGNATFVGEILNRMAAPKIRLEPTTQNNASILELGVLNGGTNAYARIDAINLNNYDSNLRFYTNAAGSTTQTLALTLNSDQSATFVGSVNISTPASVTPNLSASELVVGSGVGNQGITIYSGDTSRGSIHFADDLDEEGAGDNPAGNRDGVILYSHNTLDFNFKTAGNQQALQLKNSSATFVGTVTATHFYGDGSNLTNLPSGVDNTKLPLAGGEMTGVIEFAGTGNGYYIGASGGASAPTNELRIGSTTTTNNIGLELYHSTNPVTLGVGYSGGGALAFIESVHGSYDTNTHLRFMPGGTESWRIGSHGSNATYATSFEIKPAAAGNDFYISDNLGIPILYSDTSAGKVGIGAGATSPDDALTIQEDSADFSIRKTDGTLSTRIVQFGSGASEIRQYDASGSQKVSINTVGDSYFDGGNVGIGTTSPTAKLYIEHQGVSWNATTQGPSLGTIHLDPVGNGAEDTGNAITFGASDSGNGATAQAGIYIRSDGSYGTKMYLSTTDSYASGSKTRLMINHNGNVGIGTTSPSYKLSVDDNSVTNIPKTLLQFDASSIADNGGYNIDFRTSSNDSADRYVARIRGIRESTGALSQLSFWTESGSALEQRMTIRASGNVGIGTTTPDAKLKVQSGATSTDSNTLRITHTRSDANVVTEAAYIDMNLSGADNTTADRTNSGLKIDLDSSANGDATNEHRIYGVDSDVRFNGFSDLARGGYFYAESNYTGGKTSQLVGVYGNAVHDANSTSGGVSNMYGVYGVSNIQDLGDVDNAFGGNFLVAIGTTRGANVGVTKGVEGRIQIDKDTAIDYGAMIGMSSIIDNNEGSTPNFGTQYLFKGDYQGTTGSNAYGIHVEGDKNYFQGSVGIGVQNPSSKLQITQTSSSEGGAYVYSNAIHTGTGTNSLVSIRQDHASSTGTVLDVRGDGTGDKLIVWDNTSVSLIVKDGGNVGIGTDSPAAKLHIGPNPLLGSYTSTRTTLAVSDTANGAELILRGQSPRIWFDATAGGMGEMYLDTVQFNILSGTPTSAGSSRFYIGDSGEVGIGTDSPSANGSKTTLHINSDTNGAAIRLSQASNSSLIRYDNTNGLQIGTIVSKNLSFQTADTTAITIDTSQNTTFAGNINAPDGSATTPAFNFTSHDGNGMYLEDYDASANKEQVSFATDGTRRAWVNEPGLWTAQNLYFGGQLRKFGEWHATSGTTGEGFKFENTADSTTPLTITSAGNATFAGDVKADTHFTSSDTNATLSTNSNGTVFLRPNGKGSTTSQSTFTTSLATIGTGVSVTGHLSATTKSFLVDNPKTGGKLQYGVVESDEHGVYVRGKSDQEVVELPEEWDWLVHEDSVTVQLTSVGQMQQLFVVEQNNKRIKVSGLAPNGQYNYVVHGTRKDVDALEKHLK